MKKIETAAIRIAFLLVSVAPAASMASVPTLHENGNKAEIVWQGDNIVQLQQYRYLRFRSNGYNDRWIGTRTSKMDLCWSYHDVNDYVLVGKSFHSTEEGFVLEIEAEKPSVRGRVRTRLEGKLISPEIGFKYTLSSKLTASQKEWREVSKHARNRKPEESLALEPLDFHINRISPSDNFAPGAVPGASELYDGFVISHDGQDWRYMPQIPVPPVIRKGVYPTIHWNAERSGLPGHRIGFVDRREGGWLSELVDASAPLQIEMCWMFFDLHHNFPTGVPPWTGGRETFDAHYALTFTPLSPAQACELLDRATPVQWRSLPEYQLPVFTRYSTFDRLISRNSEYAWFASSYKCAVDEKIGYDDRRSIRIQHDEPTDISAWYAWTWGPCFDNQAPLEGAYRFSVMVKTRDCTSPFRLAVAEFLHDLWLQPDGKWTTNIGNPSKVLWHYSPQQVTGTSDWTRVTIDLPIDNDTFKPAGGKVIRRGVVLQYQGKGTIWFDNVRIEKIE